MKRPNFFIVGAPRCGTTSLWSYLKYHPDIFMPDDKELYFFDSDLWARKEWSPTLDWYLAKFSAATNQIMVGEATPSYLRSQCAPTGIKAFSPEAKIVIMLRNPVDVMHSLHSQGLRYGTELVTDFKAALEADATRVGRSLLGYREFTDFPGQVQRYFDLFGRERVHTIIFEDLKLDPASVNKGALRFLGVSPEFASEPRTLNANLRARSTRLQHLRRQVPRPLRSISRALLPGQLRTRISRIVNEWNLVEKPRAPIDPGLRRQLQNQFAPKIHELGTLLGRDLSRWVSD